MGTATEKIAPEIIYLQFVVETLEHQAQDSLRKNSEVIAKAIPAIKLLGVTEKEISTSGLQIFAEYDSFFNHLTQTYE